MAMECENRQHAPESGASQCCAELPETPACRRHPARILDTPPAALGMPDNAMQPKADYRHACAAAIEGPCPAHVDAAAAMRERHSHGISPQTAPWLQAGAEQNPTPQSNQAAAALCPAGLPYPGSAARSHHLPT